MKNLKRFFRTPCETAIVLAMAAMPVAAQEAGDNSDIAEIDEIVITGTTSSSRTKLESSVAITTVGAAELAKETPLGTADLLETVPGMFIEDSGGEISNNVAPRGLGGGAGFRFISIQEDGLPVMYDGDHIDNLMRQDITISRMEAIRGGTAGVLTVNGPASIVNFITRKGTEEPEGAVRLTVSDYGTRRGEFYYGAPLDEEGKWLLGVGGYYRVSDGIRDVGFTADHGGQFRASLTRKIDDGEITVTYKHLDDHNTFYLPIPIQNPGNNPESIPGIDANTGTLLGPGIGRIKHLTPDGPGETNLPDGYHTKLQSFGVNFEKQLSDRWSVKVAARHTGFTLAADAIFPWGLVPAADRLQESGVQDAIAQLGGTSAAYRYVGQSGYLTDLDNLNGNGLTTLGVAIDRERDVDHFASDVRFNYSTEDNDLAFGMLYVTKQLHYFRTKSSFILSDVKHNAELLDIVILDDQGQEVGTYTDNGVTRYGIWLDNSAGDVTSTSFYVNDEYQVSDSLRLDAGVRFEIADFNASQGNTANQPLVGNDTDNIIANDSANWFDGTFRTASRKYKEWSWTVGGNYTITDNMAVYARYADSYQTTGVGNVNGLAEDVAKLTFTEVGARYFGDNLSLSVVLFNTQFKNLGFGARNQATGLTEQITIKTVSNGLEFEGNWQPVDMFSLNFMGVIQSTEVKGIPAGDVNESFNGNQVQRTPNTQIRISPTVHTSFGEFFLTGHYLSKRFADLGNSVELDSYYTLDAGWTYDVNESISLQLKATNLNNAIGLSEGNPRAGFIESNAGSGGAFYARPILGRSFLASLQYNF